MKHDTYDTLIIGFGKGGKTLAGALAGAGWNVALIEKSADMYGGTCINIACIPTKVLVSDAAKSLSFDDAMAHKSAVVGKLRAKNHDMLANNPHVTLIDGTASFVDEKTVQVTAGDDRYIVTAPKIIINTGSLPALPPIDGIDSAAHVYTSTSLLDEQNLPERLAIVGGGYIGLEFASTYAKFGSQVTVFEHGDALLPRDDPEIVASVEQTLREQGIEFVFGADVTKFESDDQTVTVTHNDQTSTFDAVLVATGRRPNIDGLELDRAGVKTNERGAIVVNDSLQTSQPHIWALGDVNGGPQFTYVSLDDFRIVKSQLLGDGSYTRDKRGQIAFSVFMQLPLSEVGLSEKAARQNGHDITVFELPVSAIPRAHVDNNPRGILRAVVDNSNDKILGAALHCTNSHEIINLVKLAIDSDILYTTLRDQIYTHPTMTESLNDLFASPAKK